MKNAISQREIQLLEELIPERVSNEWLKNQELCMEICTGYEESDSCGAKIRHHEMAHASKNYVSPDEFQYIHNNFLTGQRKTFLK